MNINARNTVSFDGQSTDFFSSGAYSRVEPGGVGHGGNVKVIADSLKLTNGAIITTSTFGQGNAGNVFINARNTVSFDGEGGIDFSIAQNGFRRSSGVYGTVTENGVGQGGNVNITTRSLSVSKGAVLQVSTFGQGNAGNVFIKANDIVFDGVGSDFFFSSVLSQVGSLAVGQGGSINVTTGSLAVSNAAVLTTSTGGQGSGGSVYINANTFKATNGGQVYTSTRGSGKAGNITIHAADSIALSGSDRTFAHGQAPPDPDVINNEDPASGLFANTNDNSTGNGGIIKLNTGQMQILDGAKVTSSSQGTGDAGDIVNINARFLKLDNGSITTTSRSGTGGNIDNLLVQDLLLLRNHSQISTSAGTDQNGGGNGGNITIKAPLIVAVPKEDSDISANAFKGNGGNIQITTSGIFGIQYRPQDTPLSDITASSQFGINGTVQINNLDVDPNRGLVQLPVEVVDATRLIDQNFCAATAGTGSSFTIAGRGGLPPSPNSVLTSDAVWEDWRFTAVPNHRPTTALDFQPITPKHATLEPIVEATGWVKNEKGEIFLTANPHPSTPHSPWFTPADCHS